MAPGDYFGSFTLQGGPDDVTVNDLATENFQITVPGASSVPEPSTFSLVLSALLTFSTLGIIRSVRRRRATDQLDGAPVPAD